MEKHPRGSMLIFYLILALGFISSVLCLVAEFEKAEGQDLRWDGEFCYVPEARAFRLGIAALFCLVLVQVAANIVICGGIWLAEKAGRSAKDGAAVVAGRALLVFSWISFGVAAMLLSTASIMNKEQAYGVGWRNSECYLVRNGVFAGSGGLVLLTAGALLGSAVLYTTKTQIQTPKKLHAQGV